MSSINRWDLLGCHGDGSYLINRVGHIDTIFYNIFMITVYVVDDDKKNNSNIF